MNIDPTDRSSTLVDMIEAEFAFLVERGLRLLLEDENSVKYEHADGVFVLVFRDPNDKYVGFRVGLTRRPKDALTETELARLTGRPSLRGEYPEHADQLQASVARVAQDLRTHGERPLSGDESIFDEAMDLRRTYTREGSPDGGQDE